MFPYVATFISNRFPAEQRNFWTLVTCRPPRTAEHCDNLCCDLPEVQEKQSFTLRLSSPTFERDQTAAAEAADEQVSVSCLGTTDENKQGAPEQRSHGTCYMPGFPWLQFHVRLRFHLAAAQRDGAADDSAGRGAALPDHHACAWSGHARRRNRSGLSLASVQAGSICGTMQVWRLRLSPSSTPPPTPTSWMGLPCAC